MKLLACILISMMFMIGCSAMNGETKKSSDNGIYAVIQVKIKDPEAFQEYVKGHMPSLHQYGGKILAANPGFTVIEGTRDFDVLVIHEWLSAEAFEKWHESPEYKPWMELRQNKAAERTNILLLPKGLPEKH